MLAALRRRNARRRSHLEQRIVLALAAHGAMSSYPLSRHLRVRSGRLYLALRGLEERGHIAGPFIDAGDGLPARRYYYTTTRTEERTKP